MPPVRSFRLVSRLVLVSLCACLLLPSRAGAQSTATAFDWNKFINQFPAKAATYFRTTIMPALVAAESNEQQLPAAIKAYKDWENTLQALGFKSDPSTVNEAMASLTRAYRNAIAASHKRCFDRKDPSEVLVMVSLAKQMAIMDMKDDSPTLDVDERISRCMTFELRFTSDLRLQTPIGAEKSSLTSTIPVTLDPGNSQDATLPQLTGTGPIEYLVYDFPPPPGLPCAISLSTQGSQASVVRLSVETVLDSTGKTPPKFSNLELWFDPGAPTETVNMCGTADTKSRWLTFFKILHHAERPGIQTPTGVTREDYFIIKNWLMGTRSLTSASSGGGSVFASKTYAEPSDVSAPAFPAGVMTGKTTFELHHAPVDP